MAKQVINTVYENFVLENEIADQYNSHLDLVQFCTVDNSLQLVDGMKKIVHVYSATDGTEKLLQGEGNTRSIVASYSDAEYDILCAQNRFAYYDEEAMTDSYVVETGTRHAAVDMFNTQMADIYGAFAATNLKVEPTKFDFAAFADLVAKYDFEDATDEKIFAFVSNDDVAEIRKELKDTLQYVEAYARNGYIGTVCGVNLYRKKDATKGTICTGTKSAVKLFNKKGFSIEQERDANTRKNTVYARKYYVAALVDETKAVKMVKKSA